MRWPTLPFPERSDGARSPEMWVDEAIWGHRLYDEQTPWLAFLEFLNVLYAEDVEGRAFQEPDGYNKLRYHPKKSLHMRHILFNNPRMPAFLREVPDDEARWSCWEQFMRETAVGLSDDRDFSYVRPRFQSFEDFARVVQLLRSTAIEGDSNKRWSSKFVFPYGPAALYEDLTVRPNSVTNDRRFFGRVGELVYLMMCRSGKGEELLAHLRPLVLNDQTPWNRLVRALTSDARETPASRPGGYLPYERRPEFEDFARDWLALFECQMPGYDVIPHLVDTLGLHVVLYKLRCAHMWGSTGSHVQLVLEIIAPSRTPVRDLAVETYLTNNLASREAIEAYIRETVELSEEWQAALSSTDPYGDALTVLRHKVRWPPQRPDGDVDYSGPHSPDSLLNSADGLRSTALRRHTQHVGNVHAIYTRKVGLASRRGTRRYRYAPNDHILRSLVFAIVPRRMEFQHFLAALYERYGFIIGHRQATTYIEQGQADQKAFEDNALRLEMRLASLGLLRRLSDACAYVHNPYTIEGRR